MAGWERRKRGLAPASPPCAASASQPSRSPASRLPEGGLGIQDCDTGTGMLPRLSDVTEARQCGGPIPSSHPVYHHPIPIPIPVLLCRGHRRFEVVTSVASYGVGFAFSAAGCVVLGGFRVPEAGLGHITWGWGADGIWSCPGGAALHAGVPWSYPMGSYTPHGWVQVTLLSPFPTGA